MAILLPIFCPTPNSSVSLHWGVFFAFPALFFSSPAFKHWCIPQNSLSRPLLLLSYIAKWLHSFNEQTHGAPVVCSLKLHMLWHAWQKYSAGCQKESPWLLNDITKYLVNHSRRVEITSTPPPIAKAKNGFLLLFIPTFSCHIFSLQCC